jgi:hypothetical protein
MLHTTFAGTDEKRQDIFVETELNITIDAELVVRDDSVYDDFSVGYGGSYDQTRWSSWYDSVDGITQENGALGFSYTKAQGLFARGYPCFSLNSLKAPTFFEARLRLDNYAPTASLHLKLHTDLASGEYWVSECGMWGIEEQQIVAYCGEWAEEGFLYGPEFRSAGPDEWHTVRIEVDPTTTTFTYYIDGVEVSSHVPANAVQLKTASFTLVIENIEGANGYVDDVRVGELER